jgi:hypothetical protein
MDKRDFLDAKLHAKEIQPCDKHPVMFKLR